MEVPIHIIYTSTEAFHPNDYHHHHDCHYNHDDHHDDGDIKDDEYFSGSPSSSL